MTTSQLSKVYAYTKENLMGHCGPGSGNPRATNRQQGFPGTPVVENLPGSARHTGLIPGLGRFHTLLGSATTVERTHPAACAPQLEKPLQ